MIIQQANNNKTMIIRVRSAICA